LEKSGSLREKKVIFFSRKPGVRNRKEEHPFIGFPHKTASNTSALKMPFCYLIFQDRPALPIQLPDDGKIKTVRFGSHDYEKLTLQLGRNVFPLEGDAYMSSSPTPPVKQKRSRTPALCCVTARYVVPIDNRQEERDIHVLQRHHVNTLKEIKTALDRAKLHQIELESDRNSSNADIVAVGVECRSLRTEMIDRQDMESLEYIRRTTAKHFVVQVGMPTVLTGLPGDPVLFLSLGNAPVKQQSQDEVLLTPLQVRPALQDIKGKCVVEIVGGTPTYVGSDAGKVYIIKKDSHIISRVDVERERGSNWILHSSANLAGVAVHGERVFVSDNLACCILELCMTDPNTRDFKLVSLYHNADDSPSEFLYTNTCVERARLGTKGSGDGQLNLPTGLAIAGHLLYVCDTGNNRVQVFTLEGTWVRSWGSQGTGEGEFFRNLAITVYDEEVYVGDYDRVQVFDLDGKFKRQFKLMGADDGAYCSLNDVLAHKGLIYVTEEFSHSVQVFEPSGVLVRSWGTNGAAAGEFTCPSGLCVDDKDHLWVCDTANNRLQIFE
jgi:DNA-binding beta-propeller fold protein YncE